MLTLVVYGASPWFLVPGLALPWAWRLVGEMSSAAGGAAYTAVLLRTVRLEVVFGAMLATAAILSRGAGAPGGGAG
jgi:hypothetical protein